ncbi:MAG: hypothetical protein WBO29_02605 [Albidovulum sp.]
MNLFPAFVDPTLQGRAGNVEMARITIRFSLCLKIQHCPANMHKNRLIPGFDTCFMPSTIELLRCSARISA